MHHACRPCSKIQTRMHNKSLHLFTVRLLTTRSRTNVFGSNLPEVVSKGGWDHAWQQGVTPWDAGRSSPLLSHSSFPYLKSPENAGRRTVLIPGCGSGHDVFAFAAAGWHATGLDISETAIARCHKNQHDIPALRSISQECIRFVSEDFFRHRDSYDLIFDYTFVSSLELPMRPKWASAMASLLNDSG